MIITRKHKSKVGHIADEMRRRIIEGEIAHDTPLASSRELAVEFKVSPLTADRAIRQLVSEGLLDRFKGRGTYVKIDSPVMAKEWQIGYCEDFSSVSQYLHEKIIKDVYIETDVNELRKNNCIINMVNYKNLQSSEYCAEIFPSLDALIVSKSLLDPSTLENLQNFDGPVLLYRQEYISDMPFNQVIPDWDRGIKDVFEHLDLKLYKRFILISANTTNALSRGEAFIRQAKLCGIKEENIESIELNIVKGQSPQLYGSKFGQQFVPNDDTLIFTTSDLLAFGILDAFYERDMSPGEFELVSCDNLEARGVCPFEEKQLTTIEYPREQIIRRGVELLVDTLKRDDGSISIIKIPTSLVVRKSGLTHHNNK